MSPQVATVSIEQIHFEFDNLNIEKKTHFYFHTQMILITLRTYIQVYANRDVYDINAAPNSIDYFKYNILL